MKHFKLNALLFSVCSIFFFAGNASAQPAHHHNNSPAVHQNDRCDCKGKPGCKCDDSAKPGQPAPAHNNHPNAAPAHNSNHPGPGPAAHPGPGPAAHPGPGPAAHPGPHPGPAPAAHPGPHPGPGPAAHPGPHPGPAPAAHPGPHPGPAPAGAVIVMSKPSFSMLIRRVQNEPWTKDKMELIRREARGNYFSCEQVAALLRRINHDSNRVQLAVELYDRTIDKANWHEVMRVFDFDSSRHEVERRVHHH